MQEAKTQENLYLEPVVLQTPTPQNEILNLVKNLKVDIKFIDFKILEIFTECKFVNETEPRILNQGELYRFNDDNVFVNELENIKQSFRVEFFDIRKRPQKPLPEISISINKKLTKIIATLKKDANIKYFDGFKDSLIEYVYKKLLKVGILIGVRNDSMKEEIDKISSILRVKESLEQDFTFVIAEGVDAVKSVDDEIILHYKNKNSNIDEYGKVDYSKRGYVLDVVKNELIAEYVKPLDGKNGRDVRGNLLKVSPAKTTVAKMLEISENIEEKYDDRSIKYYAKKAGYVSQDKDGRLDIKDELDVSEISFKTTGCIDTKLDSNITLNITEKDITKDAVGAGMSVEANQLNIEGNIAENAIVKANKVTIGGQTHSKAKIEAKDAKIAVHIGYFEGDYVEIDRLEGGKVKAKNAIIKKVVGGEITAQNLQIETLGSNSNIKVAHTAEIKDVKGTNNKITVDFSLAGDTHESVEVYLTKLNELQAAAEKMPKELESKRNAIDENRAAAYTIKQKIDDFRANKITPPVTFIKKLREYQQLIGEYNDLLSEYRDKRNKITDLKERIRDLQDGAFEAKIINRGKWREFNEIKFKLVDPPREIVYNAKENEVAQVISLQKVEDEDGEIDYVIKKNNDLQ